MSKTVKSFLFFLLILSGQSVYAQPQHGQHTVDSLLPLLSKANDDVAKLGVLNLLTDEFPNINPDEGLKYGQTELKIAERLSSKKDISHAYNNIGLCYMHKNEPDKALDFLTRALGINGQIGNKKWAGGNSVNIGMIYASEAKWDSALFYYSKAEKMLSEIREKEFLANDYQNIAVVYVNTGDYPKALQELQRALKLEIEINNKTGQANCYGNLGVVYKSLNDYPRALENYTKSLQIAEAIGNKNLIAASIGNIGQVYDVQSDYPKALEYYYKGLKITEESGNRSQMTAWYNNIGNVFKVQKDYAKALENYNMTLKIAEELKDKVMICMAEVNIGTTYIQLEDYTRSMEHLERALKLARETGYKIAEGRTLGEISYHYQVRGEYEKALELGLQGLKILTEVGDKEQIAWMTGGVGSTYLDIARDTAGKFRPGRYVPQTKKDALKMAIKYLGDAIGIDNEIGAIDDVSDCYKLLSEAQALTGDHAAALVSFKNYVQLKDSIFSAQNSRKIATLDAKRETELKQKQIEVQELQLNAVKNERKYYVAGIAGLVLLSLGMVGRFRTVKKNRKNLEEKNRVIAAEKENADVQRIRAENSERFKQQFLANMSHEIRTPMNAVSGMTDLLLEKGPRPDQLEYLQAISKSSEILLHIINDILDMSKIEAGKLELETIDFSLAETVKQVKDTLSYKAEEKGLQLITHIDSNVADVVIGDPYRLNQVLINLGGNAIKFTDKGGVQIDVKRVSETNGNTALRFSVTDTGIGIPQDKLQSLFESFTQVNSSDTRKFGGTGLGLSISKQLVELQGGSISVESKEGSGTTFSFVITYKEGSAEKLLQRIAEEQKIDGHMLDGLRILVADDNEYNRMVVNETLRLKAIVDVDLVTNGQEAIQKLAQNYYDVILMDVQMPVMNGIDATKYIRLQMPAPKNQVPIIALTASILRADLDMCSESGMNSYVPKPFKAWQLVHTIADVTGRKDFKAARTNSGEKAALKDDRGIVSDLFYLRDFCEGDEVRMKKYVNLYLKAIPAFKEKLLAGVATKDTTEIALHVHSFKPKWMMMGMKTTSELATKIDQQCKDNDDGVYENVMLVLLQTDRSVEELKDRC